MLSKHIKHESHVKFLFDRLDLFVCFRVLRRDKWLSLVPLAVALSGNRKPPFSIFVISLEVLSKLELLSFCIEVLVAAALGFKLAAESPFRPVSLELNCL